MSGTGSVTSGGHGATTAVTAPVAPADLTAPTTEVAAASTSAVTAPVVPAHPTVPATGVPAAPTSAPTKMWYDYLIEKMEDSNNLSRRFVQALEKIPPAGKPPSEHE